MHGGDAAREEYLADVHHPPMLRRLAEERSLPVALVTSDRPTTTEPSAETADAALTATTSTTDPHVSRPTS
jgi:hypothetical protein